MNRVYMYHRFERFWHWAQALLVMALALTGFEIHFHLGVFPFEVAVEIHKVLAWCFVVLIVFAIFWHLTTGAWKQYLPTSTHFWAMVRYYTVGIFTHVLHPVRKTPQSKFNPLQRLAYLMFKLLIVPVLVTTGFMYYYYNELSAWLFAGELDLAPIALVHTGAAFVLVAFLFAHVYLTTTGPSPLTYVRAMITGWEKVEEVTTKHTEGH